MASDQDLMLPAKGDAVIGAAVQRQLHERRHGSWESNS